MDFKNAIKRFPRTLLEWVLGLVYFTLTEVETFMMVAVGVVMGILLGWLWGLAIFLVFWTVAHLVGNYISLLAGAIRNGNR